VRKLLNEFIIQSRTHFGRPRRSKAAWMAL
jgi:hypothetical protein